MKAIKFVPWLLIYMRGLLGLVAVVAALLGLDQSGFVFASLVAVGLLSDIFDGIIARRVGVSSERLRIFDSRADVVFFVGLVIALFLRSQEIFLELLIFVLVIAALELLVHLISFIRFRKQSSTHHYLSKVFSIILFGLIAQLFLLPQVTWFFWSVLALGCISFLESGLIMLRLQNWECDVRSIFDVKDGKLVRERSRR